MPNEITWLPSVASDIEALRAFIASNNPRAMRRAARRIIDAVAILKHNAQAGIPLTDLFDYRELRLDFGAGEYIIRYRQTQAQRIVIVRVRHISEVNLTF